MSSTGLELGANQNIFFNSGTGRIIQENLDSGNNLRFNSIGPTLIASSQGQGPDYVLRTVKGNHAISHTLNNGLGQFGNLTQAGDNIIQSNFGPLILQEHDNYTGTNNGINGYKCGVRIAHLNKRIDAEVGNTRLTVNNNEGLVEISGIGDVKGLLITNNYLWSNISRTINGLGPAVYWGWHFRPHNDGALSIVFTAGYAYAQGGRGCYIYPTSAGWTFYSDKRLKKNIVYMDSALDKVLQLKPCYYNWKGENENAPQHVGFIAQDVKELFPDFITSTTENDEKYLGLSMTDFVPLLTQSIKEQQTIILNQKERIETLESQVQTLQSQMQRILEKLNL